MTTQDEPTQRIKRKRRGKKYRRLPPEARHPLLQRRPRVSPRSLLLKAVGVRLVPLPGRFENRFQIVVSRCPPEFATNLARVGHQHRRVAGAPVATKAGVLNFYWSGTANLDAQKKGILTTQHVYLIRGAVMAKCDSLDGLRDGVIEDNEILERRAGADARMQYGLLVKRQEHLTMRRNTVRGATVRDVERG